jgi:integrase
MPATAKIKLGNSFHGLRYARGSALATRGVPMGVTAQFGDSGARMTEKHYAHLTPSHAAEHHSRAFLKTGIADETIVVTITLDRRRREAMVRKG